MCLQPCTSMLYRLKVLTKYCSQGLLGSETSHAAPDAYQVSIAAAHIPGACSIASQIKQRIHTLLPSQLIYGPAGLLSWLEDGMQLACAYRN